MKVIFLDHDGVMVTSKQFGTRFTKQRKRRYKGMTYKDVPVSDRFDNFDKKAVTILNEILVRTNTEIVVSSDWKRSATLEEMREYYKLQGVVKLPLAFTPSVTITSTSTRIGDIRVLEINEFLQSNDITSWVAIDDLDLSALSNFVHCPRVSEGIKQTGVKDKVLSFLFSDTEKIDSFYNGEISMKSLISKEIEK